MNTHDLTSGNGIDRAACVVLLMCCQHKIRSSDYIIRFVCTGDTAGRPEIRLKRFVCDDWLQTLFSASGSLSNTLLDSMLIGICGSISAGKQSVAAYLVKQQSFSRLHLASGELKSTSPSSPSAANCESTPDCADKPEQKVFGKVEELLKFITERWQQRWVTTDISDEDMLEKLLRRPSFLLVSVDAPLSLRWQRCKAR